MRIPALTTDRLVIREFVSTDLDAAHQLLDVDLADADLATDGATTLPARRRWLDWAVASYEQLAHLRQPPYTDRAIVLRATGELIGACGLVPCLTPFHQLPGWAELLHTTEEPASSTTSTGSANTSGTFTAEVGLCWAIATSHRRQGFATEAARALVAYAFSSLRLARIVATTRHDNHASMAVMRRLGMRILRNPLPDPPWFQVVGLLRP
jgi:ribosomal-protein-alanine N-acetyltransferase